MTNSHDVTSYKALLTDRQWEAVSHLYGPLLILAGAGSGKTRVITYRICHLINHYKVSPFQILAMTFTNKAANEMKERVDAIVDGTTRKMSIGTFHSICVKILRLNLHHIGMKNNFVIFAEDDQLKLIKSIFLDFNYSTDSWNPKSVSSVISNYKNARKGVSDVLDSDDPMDARIGLVYQEYEKRLRKLNALDFDDLLLYAAKLLEEAPSVLSCYQNQWQYVLVDEFQDTNTVQLDILKLLVGKRRNICVVGDDDQSIYRWRGAEVTNILDFDKIFPNTKIVKLEQNYRSTKHILRTAGAVIRNNLKRREKTLWTENDEGVPIDLYEAIDERDEADYIAGNIGKLRNSGLTYSQIAVLYRVNAQSRAIEESMQRFHIPYRIIGGLKFYDRKEIKDILAYLKFVNNQQDNFSLLRIINTPPRGIGKGTIEKLVTLSQEKEITIFEAIQDAVYRGAFAKNVHEKLDKFSQLIVKLLTVGSKYCLSELTEGILEATGYIDHLKKQKDPDLANRRIDNIKELVSATQEFEVTNDPGGLSEFIDYVSLLSDTDSEDNDAGVTLMTLHAAKGLEFPAVFMAGMESNILPHARSMSSQDDLEEERRLCYVGITRAMASLYMIYANTRTIYGKTTSNPPSIFLTELPAESIRRAL